MNSFEIDIHSKRKLHVGRKKLSQAILMGKNKKLCDGVGKKLKVWQWS
jgi:hypothetical protein